MIDCLMLLSAYPSVSILQVDFFLPQEISQSGSFVAPEEMREFLTDLDDTAEGGIATSLQLLTQILFTQKKYVHTHLLYIKWLIAAMKRQYTTIFALLNLHLQLVWVCLNLVCPQISQFCIRLPPNFTILSHFCQQQKYLAFQFSWILDRYLMVFSRVPQHPCPPLGELVELVVAATGWTASAPRWEWPGPDALGAPASTCRRSAGANWQAPRDPRAVGVGCKETWDFTRKNGELTCLGTT